MIQNLDTDSGCGDYAKLSAEGYTEINTILSSATTVMWFHCGNRVQAGTSGFFLF